MKIIKSPFQGCFLFKEKIIKDKRGHFLEIYNYEMLKGKSNFDFFVQENESFQTKMLFGMHYQQEPYSQNKIIRV